MKTNPKLDYVKGRTSSELIFEDPLAEELNKIQNGSNKVECPAITEEPLHLRLKHQLMQKLHPNGIPNDDEDEDFDDDTPLNIRLMKRRYPKRCKKQKKEELVNQMKNQLKKVLKNGGLNKTQERIVLD